MSRLYCVCGQTVRDITDNPTYTAHFLPDEDTGHALDDLLEQVAEFIKARERGEQAQYLKEHEIVLREPTLESILRSLFYHPAFEFERLMYECEWCGRIWMQARPHTNEWALYGPEWPRPRRGILSHEGVVVSEE